MFETNPEKDLKKFLAKTQDEELKSLILKHLLEKEDLETEEPKVEPTKVEEPKKTEEPVAKEEKEQVDVQKLVSQVKEEVTKVYDEKLAALEAQLKAYQENAPKVQSFGAQPKQSKGTDAVTFEDVFMGTRK